MGFENPDAERTALERTYEDTATVSRVTHVTGANKITKSVSAVIYSDIICALSRSSDKSVQTKAQNKIDYDAVIFLTPVLSVLPGDKIALKRFGRTNSASSVTYDFEVVGRPVVYATHQEVKVRDGDLS